ncbi:MAG: helix-turn-helix domain-containing protein [Rubrimonas sp.]
MADSDRLELRGFDSYRVSLGDELRGERASLGKSLLDVQRDLRIKAAHIDAIENSDPSRIPFDGFVTGYVRAYARYLGLDEDEVLDRFCRESGFQPSTSTLPDKPGYVRSPRNRDLDAVLAGSRLAAVSRASALNADLGSTLRGVGSLAVLATLVGGIIYGGWSLLESIQRIEFGPAPDAPEAMVALPEFDSMMRVARATLGPAPEIDVAALAAVYAAQEAPPPIIRAMRDGPISALDPSHSGIYADLSPSGRIVTTYDLQSDEAGAQTEELVASSEEPGVEQFDQKALAQPSQGVALLIDSEAWVRVRNATGVVVHEALMKPGTRWAAPADASGFTLRAGNAGGVFLEVDGQRFGPLGGSGAVVSNVLLDADAIRRVFPLVTEAGATEGVAVSAQLDAAR